MKHYRSYDISKKYDYLRSKTFIENLRMNAGLLKSRHLVTVVMPTWNRLEQTKKAVKSIETQTYTDYEVIIIDDYSDPWIFDDLKETYKNNKKIKVIGNYKEKGVSNARNCGLECAKGEIIAYLDSDNIWEKDYLENMVLALEVSGANSAYAGIKLMTDDGERFRFVPYFDYENLRYRNYIDLNTFVHRKSRYLEVGGFDKDLRRAVDWDFIIRITKDMNVCPVDFIGVEYEHRDEDKNRLTLKESFQWTSVVANKHLIDWDSILRNRIKGLTSIIICGKSMKKLILESLENLERHEAGSIFEIVVVIDDSSVEEYKALKKYISDKPHITVVRAPSYSNMSLRKNLGFSYSKGEFTVFLDIFSRVTDEWLLPLLQNLGNPDIKGVQPYIVNKDGSINNIGYVLGKAIFAYPIYENVPGDVYKLIRTRSYQAITEKCMCVRAVDFAGIQGFCCLYTAGNADVDLCLRLGKGKEAFACIPDSVVIYNSAGNGNEEKTRTREVENRAVFYDRWNGKVKTGTDLKYYEEDGVGLKGFVSDGLFEDRYQRYSPEYDIAGMGKSESGHFHKVLNRTVAIKISCPSREFKKEWGDYHFAVSLSHALARKGVKSRIDFNKSWRFDNGRDLVLNLRGSHPYPDRFRNLTQRGIMWMISHPDKVSQSEIGQYAFVFVASKIYADRLRARFNNVSVLFQCTDISRFYPRLNRQLRIGNLFVANSRGVLREVVRHALKEGIDIEIYGGGWEGGVAPAEWVHGLNVMNAMLPEYYTNARSVLNDHWADMKEKGFPSNRIFDVLACGRSIVTDEVEGLPDDIRPYCSFFGERSLKDAIEASIEIKVDGEYIRQKYSFDAAAYQILEKFESFIDENEENLVKTRHSLSLWLRLLKYRILSKIYPLKRKREHYRNKYLFNKEGGYEK